MVEAIRHDYEVSSEGAVRHWEIPYLRLTDVTPTPTCPAEVTSLLPGTQLTGTILTVDTSGVDVAVIDFTSSMVYRHEVRNVLTYAAQAEVTWGPINIGDLVYYDNSATMIVLGLFLSTAPASGIPDANTLFGYVVPANDADVFPKGGIVASTQECAVMQIGAGH
jgi:hypothetical protein